MTAKLISLRTRAISAMQNRDAGQGTLEYVGMIIIAALVIVAVAAVITPDSISSAVGTAIESVTGLG